MKRVLSLLAVVSVVSFPMFAGAQEPGPTCPPPEYPTLPPVPEPINLDTWDFNGTPLFPRGMSSMYLVAFASPVDATRAYVYGIDAAANRILFAGSIAKRFAPNLTMRAGLDIGNFQISGTADPRSAILIQIEEPPPPPPLPNVHDPSIQNYAKLAHQVAAEAHQLVGKLVR